MADRIMLLALSSIGFVLRCATADLRNVALGRPTTASSKQSISGRAVDGNTNSHYIRGGSCWETYGVNVDAFWMVDLGTLYKVTSVAITNRGDCCADRLQDFSIVVYRENPVHNPMTQSQMCAHRGGAMRRGGTETLPCAHAYVIGQFVRISPIIKESRLQLCEVAVFATPATSDSCWSAFVQQVNTRNMGTIILTVVTSRAECSVMCYKRMGCHGFNFAPQDNTCELVSINGTLVTDSSWNYYGP